MKVGVLTSSRSDYSIYYPLLRALASDPAFHLEIIAFGMHLSKNHGLTVRSIVSDGFNVAHSFDTMPENDSPAAISEAMAKTIKAFSSFWTSVNYDLVFCLGDRYEMFAACASSVPFNIKLAHIHGGEETLGAIDDAFRHSITHMSSYHFAAAEQYRQRIVRLKGSDENAFNVGSLSFDNLKHLRLLSTDEFFEQFKIDLTKPTILITFHPETVSFDRNEFFVKELISALDAVHDYQFVITMPNADTKGNMIREYLNAFIATNKNANGVETFGTIGYLSCMKHCSFMLGNTSSGFIEASFFPKFVINLGNRQRGRILTKNIMACSINKREILTAIEAYKKITLPDNIDIYGDGNTVDKIVAILKSIVKKE